ncbi:metalloprotease RseP [Loigolactobacillus backii]|uniref:RIP metalloprotease RseP n=1 Tax=Loigolactobacillus backii TaxID=375175 RepID=UPI0007F10B36|nr:RIP metalloprotease RseP [Loigolactobacillus backii]ANK64652.1 metalloprotease RseP [Loigolactobacillus backii]
METLIVFILIFGAIVIVHEFGHFYFAKRSGILVREFSIGMGPKLWASRRNETTYTLRLLPIGGYVRMAGIADDEDDELQPGTSVLLTLNEQQKVSRINVSQKVTLNEGIPFEIAKSDLQDDLFIEGYENGDEAELRRYDVDHDATIIEKSGTEVQIAPRDVQFQSASIPKRLLTNFAGILNNLILGIIGFILVAFLMGGVAKTSNELGTIQDNSPAQSVGLKAGDHITAVNGVKTPTFQDVAQQVNRYPNKKITLTVRHKGTSEKITATPRAQKTNGKKVGVLGVAVALDTSFSAKIAYGFTQPWFIVSQTFKVIGGMFVHGFNLNNFGGPVAMYAMTSQAAQSGLPTIINLMAYLSISVGVMNLLPISALDGGKILLNLVEAVRGKPIDPEKEGIISLIGFGLMLLLMILVTWNDVQRFFIR